MFIKGKYILKLAFIQEIRAFIQNFKFTYIQKVKLTFIS